MSRPTRQTQGPATHRPMEVTGPPAGSPAGASVSEIPTIWTTGWTDVFNTGTWRAATPVHEWRPSPCHVDCPIGNAIPRWIKPIGEGAYQEAWLALVETNPFPAVTGRVCHHPCEGHCNREVLEAVVGINGLEHFLGDRALEEGWALPAPGDAQGKRVAVVGGGPAGLSCAYHLRRLGYEVTVFEARAELGGLLRYGIPEYRLRASVVDGEIRRILDMGVEARAGAPVSDTAGLEAVEAEFDAVFLSVGAQQAKTLPHLEDGAGAGRVLDGLEYLRRCTEGVARDLGERMVVVGGGSAAMDVARSARRLGHQVSLVALEARAVMPALPEEIEQALEEGVALFDGAMVAAVEAAPGAAADRGLTLRCVKVTLDPTAPAGMLRPLPVEGGEFTLAADVIVTAIGQDPDLASYGDGFLVERAVLTVDPTTLATSRPGVFAGGDVASTDRFVSEAVGAGRRAAFGIAEHLGHPEARAPRRPLLEEAVNRKEVNPFYFDFAERRERAVAPVAERLAGFTETVSAYPEAEAAAEARRCMSCGLCVECDNCFVFCPDMAVQKKVVSTVASAGAEAPAAGGAGVAASADVAAGVAAGLAGAADEAAGSASGAAGAPPGSGPFYFVLDQYCKGCGLCVTECPRGAVRLEQVTR